MYRAIFPLFVLFCAACGGQPALLEPPPPAVAERTVVLLHGYARRPGSLGEVAERLAGAGYRVCNIGYGSLRGVPADIVASLEDKIAGCGVADESLDFVTHSFGGILVRAYAREAPPGRVRRVVMLAPPNHGSELSDIVGSSRLLGFLTGPVVPELGTSAASLPNRLGPPTFVAGIIAGSRSVHPVGYFVLDGPNDGTVTVASARLAGMRDFAVVPRAHSFIMNAPEVLAEIEAFLTDGCFSGAFENVTYEDRGGCAHYRARTP